MADDDLVQPMAQQSAVADAAPSESSSGGASKMKPENSPHDERLNNLDDDEENPRKAETFNDVFDFLVGINPDRLANLVFGKASDLVTFGYSGGMDWVRGMLTGGGESVTVEGAPRTPPKGPGAKSDGHGVT